jgi:TetR/AcrR family fatty acid metabolism transcriptional regulator
MRSFYRHPAYDEVRRYAGVMLSILEDGIKLGVFRDDVNMRIVRDMILGALEWEIINLLVTQEWDNSAQDLQGIMALICNMIEIRHSELALELNKPSRLLRAAEKVFAEKGYRQATIAEIARTANVAEGTIYEYFKNKEDLLLSIPKRQFKDQIDSLKEVFEIKTPLRKLRRFIRYHFFLLTTKLDFLKVLLLDVLLNPGFYRSEAYGLYKKYIHLVDQILEEGKKDGSIEQDINDRIFSNLLFGSFNHITFRWLFLDQKSEVDRLGEIDEVALLLTRAVSREGG